MKHKEMDIFDGLVREVCPEDVAFVQRPWWTEKGSRVNTWGRALSKREQHMQRPWVGAHLASGGSSESSFCSVVLHSIREEPRLAALAAFSKLTSLGALSSVTFKYCLFRSKRNRGGGAAWGQSCLAGLPLSLMVTGEWSSIRVFSPPAWDTLPSQEDGCVPFVGIGGFLCSSPSCARFKTEFYNQSPIFPLASANSNQPRKFCQIYILKFVYEPILSLPPLYQPTWCLSGVSGSPLYFPLDENKV